MATRTSVAASADVSVDHANTFRYGGPNLKKRKSVPVVLNNSQSAVDTPWTVGADAGDIPVSLFGLTKAESCSNLLIYTTSTGAPLRIYSAAPSPDGTSIILSDSGQAAGAKADFSLTATESAKLVVVGW